MLRLCLALGCGGALAFAGYAVASSSSRLASGTATFADPAGDSGNAADVTKVVVSNDDANNLTLAITLANRPAFFIDDFFFIALDTDRNASTGANGFDYAIGAAPLGPACSSGTGRRSRRPWHR